MAGVRGRSTRPAWRACSCWTAKRSTLLRLGILGTLGAFLVGAPLAAAGRLGPVGTAQTVALFRLGIAATVLPLAFLAPRAAVPPEAGIPQVPFPMHIQALIGTAAVLWLFRLVGLAWVVLALWN